MFVHQLGTSNAKSITSAPYFRANRSTSSGTLSFVSSVGMTFVSVIVQLLSPSVPLSTTVAVAMGAVTSARSTSWSSLYLISTSMF